MTSGLARPTERLPRYFYRTAPQPCPYLAGRVERNIFAELSGPDLTDVYGLLVRHGFRRSHSIVYRPDCPSCRACVPVRVVVADFTPSRSLRRVAHLNRDIVVTDARTQATVEQHRLFRSYVAGRHHGGEMASMTFDEYRAMVESTVVRTRLVEFRKACGTLCGACLVDRLNDGLSAVYSFFEPQEVRRSLGTYMILWLIERARAEGLAHAYLGYWIAASRKMAYKTRFQPLEALGRDGWQRMRL